MIPLAAPTAMLQGKVYDLRPFSVTNYEILETTGVGFKDALENGEMIRFQYWDAMLKLCLVEPFEWDVDSDEFDGREAENAIIAFLPPSMQISVLLLGFQPA